MLSLNGFILALITAVAFSTFALLSRTLAKGSKDPLAFSVVYGLFAALFSLIILLIEPWEFGDITYQVLLITFLATVFFGVFEASEFFARKHLEASRLTVLFQLTPVVTFLGSILLLQETFSLGKVLAIGLIVGGNIVAMYKHSGHITKLGLIFSLVTVASLGLAYIADKAVFQNYPLGIYMFITYFMPSLYIFLFLNEDKIKRMTQELKRIPWQLPLLSFVSILGYYLLLKTFRVAEASVAVPIIYSSTILTAFGGILILKEKSSIPQKIFGAIFVFLGVLLLK